MFGLEASLSKSISRTPLVCFSAIAGYRTLSARTTTMSLPREQVGPAWSAEPGVSSIFTEELRTSNLKP